MKLKSGRNKLFWGKNGTEEVRHVARCEPHVQTINILKYLKNEKISNFFGLRQNVRERREKKTRFSSAISLGSTGRNSEVQELKLLYATRVTCGYRNHKISPRFKV